MGERRTCTSTFPSLTYTVCAPCHTHLWGIQHDGPLVYSHPKSPVRVLCLAAVSFLRAHPPDPKLIVVAQRQDPVSEMVCAVQRKSQPPFVRLLRHCSSGTTY